eukprot:gene15295-biopygen7511
MCAGPDRVVGRGRKTIRCYLHEVRPWDLLSDTSENGTAVQHGNRCDSSEAADANTRTGANLDLRQVEYRGWHGRTLPDAPSSSLTTAAATITQWCPTNRNKRLQRRRRPLQEQPKHSVPNATAEGCLLAPCRRPRAHPQPTVTNTLTHALRWPGTCGAQ